MVRALPAACALPLLCACPDSSSLVCPDNTTQVAQFAFGFSAQHPAGECVAVSVDGGDAGVGPLALDDAGQTQTSVCFGTGSVGPQLTLVLPGNGNLRQSPLLDGGAFAFTGATDGGTNGTNCACNVNISETFSGNLTALDADAGLALLPDGGLPPVAGLSGTVTDTLIPVDAGDPTCICAMPCTVTYGVLGTPF